MILHRLLQWYLGHDKVQQLYQLNLNQFSQQMWLMSCLGNCEYFYLFKIIYYRLCFTFCL